MFNDGHFFFFLRDQQNLIKDDSKVAIEFTSLKMCLEIFDYLFGEIGLGSFKTELFSGFDIFNPADTFIHESKNPLHMKPIGSLGQIKRVSKDTSSQNL